MRLRQPVSGPENTSSSAARRDKYLPPAMDAQVAIGLIRKYHTTGDPTFLNRIVEGNQRLLSKLADKYASVSCPTEDLFQEAAIGFRKSLERYQISKRVAPSTFAYYGAVGAIIAYIERHARTVRIPANTLRLALKAQKALYEVADRLGVSPETLSLRDAASEHPDLQTSQRIPTLLFVESVTLGLNKSFESKFITNSDQNMGMGEYETEYENNLNDNICHKSNSLLCIEVTMQQQAEETIAQSIDTDTAGMCAGANPEDHSLIIALLPGVPFRRRPALRAAIIALSENQKTLLRAMFFNTGESSLSPVAIAAAQMGIFRKEGERLYAAAVMELKVACEPPQTHQL